MTQNSFIIFILKLFIIIAFYIKEYKSLQRVIHLYKVKAPV